MKTHGRDQIIVQNADGEWYRSNTRLDVPKGWSIVMRDKWGFSIYDEHGDLLSNLWNYRRLPWKNNSRYSEIGIGKSEPNK